MSLRSELSDLRVDPLDLTIAAPAASKPMRFGALYARMLGLEFIVVALTAYASSMAYQYTALDMAPAIDQYVAAAVFLAALVSIVSVAFRHFVAMQRQPWHALLWNGMGAVALAFSFFLSTLFLLKIIGNYSRGAFIFQVIAVSLAVCATRTALYFRLQSAIRAGLVEARHVVLIGSEASRSRF